MFIASGQSLHQDPQAVKLLIHHLREALRQSAQVDDDPGELSLHLEGTLVPAVQQLEDPP